MNDLAILFILALCAWAGYTLARQDMKVFGALLGAFLGIIGIAIVAIFMTKKKEGPAPWEETEK